MTSISSGGRLSYVPADSKMSFKALLGILLATSYYLCKSIYNLKMTCTIQSVVYATMKETLLCFRCVLG